MTEQGLAGRLVTTYATTELLNQATAARILIELGDVLACRPRADLALTGGRDACDLYADVAAHPLAGSVDWSRVHLWWSDERFVEPSDPERNAKQARDIWFGQLISDGLMPESNIHEMPVDSRTNEEAEAADDDENDARLAEAARAYDRELVGELGQDPRFDLAIFGVGPDGHFASLFPDRQEVLIDDPANRVVGVSHSPKMPPLRVSLTVPVIRRSRKVWMFTSTPSKAHAVAQALSRTDDPHVPSSFARGTQETRWLLDAQAAAELEGRA